MTQKSLDEIRALRDPKAYLEGMEAVQKELNALVDRLFVNLDLTADSPSLLPAVRKASLEELERAIFDAQWRIDEIDRRVEQARNGAMGNRAAKRRAAKAK